MSVRMRAERSEGGSARNGSISRSRTLRPCRKVYHALEQDRPKLVQERLACCHQTRAGPVQGLQVKPVLALQLDEAHGRPRCCFRNPLGIVVIILLCPNVWSTYSGDINRTLCPFAAKRRPIRCAPQHASMATVQDVSLPANSASVARLTRRRRHTRPAASRPTMLFRFLPRSIPRVTMVIGSLLPLKPAPKLAAGGRGGPSHKMGGKRSYHQSLWVAGIASLADGQRSR